MLLILHLSNFGVMDGLEKAQLKDRILRELPLLEMNETEFYENLGKPVKSMAHFKAILEEIKNYNSQFIETSFIFSNQFYLFLF